MYKNLELQIKGMDVTDIQTPRGRHRKTHKQEKGGGVGGGG